MKMKTIQILTLIIIVAFLFIFYGLMKDDNIKLELSDDFIKKFNIKTVSNNYDSITLNGKYNDLSIKIKILNNTDLKQAKNYISDKMFVIDSMYREIDSPYPGTLSNKIKCEEEFKPKKISNIPFDYYLLYASDRFTYGACSWDLISYKSVIYYVYCNKTKNLHQIELFIPKNIESSSYEESLTSITC